MKEILLHNGMVARVDDVDFERANKFHWTARKSSCGTSWYASRFVRKDAKRNSIVEWMHHFIFGKLTQLDHCDGDGLNNCRSNLRLASDAENCANRRINSNNTTGFKGVSWHKRSRKYTAQIGRKGPQKHVGMFETAEAAAKAYDAAAIERFGEFARLNFPTTQHPHSIHA